MVYGDGFHPGSVHTIMANPAGVTASTKVGVQFGANVGAAYEFGDLSNILDNIDDVSNLLDEDSLSLEVAEERINRLQGILNQLGKDGHGKFTATGSVPFVVGKADSGWAVGIELAGDMHAGFSVLDDELRYVAESQEIQSRTSIYLRGAQMLRLSLVPSYRLAEWGEQGLYIGGRISHYNADMYKTVIALEDTERDMAKVIDDDLEQQVNSSTALGFDLGVMYQARIFRGGLTWLNVNQPEFDFPAVGVACGQIADPDLQTNCYTAASFGDRISLQETWKLNEQARAEFALHDPEQRFVFAASYDLNLVRDISGDEYQWLTLSGSYRLPWYLKWIPDLRIGYRQNQVGSELAYYSAGLSWLGVLTLDAAVSAQSIEHDGESMPRSAMANLGLQVRF